MASISTLLATSLSGLLNGSCYKKHEYIWFMGGNLNGFQDIKCFMKRTRWGMPRGAHGDIPIVLLNASHHKK